MYNYLLLRKTKTQMIGLNYLGISKLNGLKCYEILINELPKNYTTLEHHFGGEIIVDSGLIFIHLGNTNINKAINLNNPYK